MELIIYIDGGSRGNPGPGASGWVIKDTRLKILAKDGVFLESCTNNQAEYTALEMALQKALELGGTKLKIFSDSLLLVNQYYGLYKIKSPSLKIMMPAIQTLARRFKSFTLTHVPREQNKEADAVCNAVMDAAAKNLPIKKSETKKQPEQGELFSF